MRIESSTLCPPAPTTVLRFICREASSGVGGDGTLQHVSKRQEICNTCCDRSTTRAWWRAGRGGKGHRAAAGATHKRLGEFNDVITLLWSHEIVVHKGPGLPRNRLHPARRHVGQRGAAERGGIGGAGFGWALPVVGLVGSINPSACAHTACALVGVPDTTVAAVQQSRGVQRARGRTRAEHQLRAPAHSVPLPVGGGRPPLQQQVAVHGLNQQ